MKTEISEYCVSKLKSINLYNEEYVKRLEYELQTISEQKFEPIFIICHKIVKWAKSKKINVGVGRGSAAGSLVCYLLGITGIDPIKYDLRFERFLIKGRISPPDIDIDFENSRRNEVYEYIEELIGKDRVTRICTFSFMRARSAIRDVGRVLKIELSDINQIIDDMPDDLSIKEISKNFSMSKWINKYPELFEYAGVLENKPRHISVHAAGVVIANENLIDLIPLRYSAKNKQITTAWNMYDLEELGFIKIDILGLKNLDVISEIIKLTKGETSCEKIDNLNPNDSKVLNQFAEGNTTGIFQFERDYVKDILKEINVDSFNDLVAVNAMIRPGALSANAPAEYAKRKRGKKYRPIHGISKILFNTYGLLTYQEQAMSISRTVAGFTIGESDKLRKIIAKTHGGKMSELKNKFINGAINNNYAPIEAQKIWELLEGAGAYMFNKAHSTCYSYIAYQLMFLKTYFVTEFWTAMINSKINKPDEIRKFVKFLKRNGFTLLYPSAAKSKAMFYPVQYKVIQAGFSCLKGVKKAAYQLENLENRSSITEFIESLNVVGRRIINKTVIESLLKANAFQCYNKPIDEIRDMLVVKKKKVKKVKKIDETYLQFG